ncbi:hypothetical protein HMPREF9195_00324 [Treponema medium ATCC 700293]|uniref:Uncharacterized protein n=2 Tax=Treponema medium TaxID=58231 RepID=A0AA87NN95_TREMD|nr:hypothetical protein [Treponema medium]EPF29621.1 hypothetical protein HMPREF9195_00324 [Treponema medium ATCC 700293]
MLKLKAPLIIAGATCVLSMLIGLISGVRFLHILGRGLIAGIGAGIFVLCARILLERFIPDLFTSPASSDIAETASSSSGANINITLDDDLGVAAPVTAGDNAETTATPNAAETQAESQSTESGSGRSLSNSSDSDNARKNTESVDSSPLSFDDSSQDDNSGLSDLPNMGSFIDDDGFDENENIDDSIQTDSSGFSMIGIQTGGTDSKVMAQAIRTVLATED